MFSLTNARYRDARQKVEGVVIGIVTDNQNKDGAYAVKVAYPALSNADEETSFWARVCTLGAGPEQGWFALPEVGDEVCVAFVNGDRQHPIVVGTLWNKDRAAWRNNNGTKDGQGDSPAGRNNVRGFKSRGGHRLTFNDDIDGENKNGNVIIKTNHGHRVELSDKNGSLTCRITTGDGDNSITLDETNKKITMECKHGNIEILAPDGDVKIAAKTIHTKSTDATMEMSNLAVTASSKIDMNSRGTTDVVSTAVTTIKGQQVHLNPDKA